MRDCGPMAGQPSTPEAPGPPTSEASGPSTLKALWPPTSEASGSSTSKPSLLWCRDRPKVIYVMGAGRSGSTIFGVTLGNCKAVFYAGELDAWLLRSGAPQLDGSEHKRFWGAVREHLDEDVVELFGNGAQRYIERSLAPFRIRGWPARRRMRAQYRRVAEDLYVAIGGVAEATHVVDTSHYPLRARELQGLKGVELYLVYLVRDPRSVVRSFARKDVAQYSKSPLTTNIYLWLTNLLAVPVFLRHRRDRRILVRYEDFIANPQSTLRDILERVGASAELPDLDSLRTGLPFQGNRVIRSDVVALEKSPSNPPPRSLITTVLQLPWAVLLSRVRCTASPSRRQSRASGLGA
jgi:hypothetical protein